MAFLTDIQEAFRIVVEYSVLLIESVGMVILIYTTLRSILGLLRRRGQQVRLKLAEGIALALEFKLGSEVLRTIIVREWNELIILGAIIALRGALTLLIHWEIKNEEFRLGNRDSDFTQSSSAKTSVFPKFRDSGKTK